MHFQLCLPAGDASCYYLTPFLAHASCFQGKCCAALCYLVTQRNQLTQKRSAQNQCPESEQEPQALPALDGAGLAAFVES